MDTQWSTVGYCTLDSIPLDKHERCKRCGILLGEYHLETLVEQVNGKTLCGWCFAEVQRDWVQSTKHHYPIGGVQ